MLAGCIEASTISGQRIQVDELTLETSRTLPPGWAKLRSRGQPGAAYYHCKMSGVSQWQRPQSRDGTSSAVPDAKAEVARGERAATERATSTSSTTHARRARHEERSRQRRERRERRRRGT